MRGVIPVNDLGRHMAGLREQLAATAARVIESGWYILGPHVNAFEAAFASYCGARYCVGVANGTDALELALRAAGVRPGTRVITVANAGGYSTAAILASGGEPAYVDIDARTMLIDTGRMAARVAGDAGAILITHLYGRMVPMPAVMEVANRAGIPVIEDCAQAHGASILDRRAGSWGHAGCFSFYPTKNLGAIGDAGAVVTNDAAMATRVRELRQYGWCEKYHAHAAGGRNSRLDEMQAAMLLEQLPFLDSWNERRRAIAQRYSHELGGSMFTVPDASGEEYVAHLYVLRTRDRGRVRERLAAAGIATDAHYPIADHQQPAWRSESWARVCLPETEAACREVITLPCFPELTNEEGDRVVGALLQR